MGGGWTDGGPTRRRARQVLLRTYTAYIAYTTASLGADARAVSEGIGEKQTLSPEEVSKERALSVH